MLERIGYLILRGEIYERIYLQPTANTEADMKSVLKRVLIDLYATILSTMCIARRLFGQGTSRRTLHAVINPNEVKSLVDKLAGKGHELSAEAQACASSLADSEFRRLRDILDKPLARIDSHMENMWAQAMSGERGEMLKWISPIPYESDHEFARRGRLEGSGEWLLERDDYREWKNSSSSTMFWLHGIREFSPMLPEISGLLGYDHNRRRPTHHQSSFCR